MPKTKIPLWLKIVLSVYLAVFLVVYWIHAGPLNFLWFSDFALISSVIAFWLESALIVSAMACGVLLFELAWLVDFLGRLLFDIGVFGTSATGYMFDETIALEMRLMSLSFHVMLPVILLWGIYKLGYHFGAWRLQTALTWIIYPLCYFFTDPESNINWVYGPSNDPQTWMPDYVWVLTLMVVVPLLIFLPTHIALKRLFPRP